MNVLGRQDEEVDQAAGLEGSIDISGEEMIIEDQMVIVDMITGEQLEDPVIEPEVDLEVPIVEAERRSVRDRKPPDWHSTYAGDQELEKVLGPSKTPSPKERKKRRMTAKYRS